MCMQNALFTYVYNYKVLLKFNFTLECCSHAFACISRGCMYFMDFLHANKICMLFSCAHFNLYECECALSLPEHTQICVQVHLHECTRIFTREATYLS